MHCRRRGIYGGGQSLYRKNYREFYHDPEFIFPMSEGCLYLNIWVPKCRDTENDRFIKRLE